MKRIEKRLLAILLVIFQFVSLIPATGLAEDNTKTVVAATMFSGTLNNLSGNYWVVVGNWESGKLNAYPLNRNSQTRYSSPEIDENAFEWVVLKEADSESAALGAGTHDIVYIVPNMYGGEHLTEEGLENKYNVALQKLDGSNYQFVFTRTNVPTGDALVTDIKFYDYDDTNLTSAPALSDNMKYYLFVAANEGSWESIASWSNETPWTLLEVDMAGQTSKRVSAATFSTNNYSNNNRKAFTDLTEEERANLKARLICSSKSSNDLTLGALQNMAQWETSAYLNMINGAPEGFEACGSGNSSHRNGIVNATDHNYEISFIKTGGHEANLVVAFDKPEDLITINSGEYFVLFEAAGDNNARYYYTKPVEIAGGQATCSLPLDGSWSGSQTFSPNWTVTGQVIKAAAGKSLSEGGYKPSDGDYLIPDLIKGYSYSIAAVEPYTNPETHATVHDYQLTLSKTVFSAATTPEGILGDAAEYGIIANRYEQTGHTETNFAVNSFWQNNSQSIEIDGSGTNAIPFYVGRIDDGAQIWLAGGNKVPADIFIRPEDETYHNLSTDAYGKLRITSTKPTNVYTKSESEINAYVNGLINAGRATSQAMAGRSIIAPYITQNSKILDLTSYPDDVTIYVDGSNINWSIDGWEINKLPGQSVVFNIPDTNARVGEFYVNEYVNGVCTRRVQSTTAALDGNPEKNKAVDEAIFQHITFNCFNATTLHINNASGLFLAPNATKVTQSNGAGWILTGGTVQSGSEWHFYRHKRHYKAIGEKGLMITKQLLQNGEAVTSDAQFTFRLYESNANWAQGQEVDHVTGTTGQELHLKKIKKEHTDLVKHEDGSYDDGIFYYIIKEDQPTEEQGGVRQDDGSVLYNDIYYSGEVIKLILIAHNVPDPNDSSKGTIQMTFKRVTPEHPEGEALSEADDGSIDLGSFTNTKKNKTGKISVTKVISGVPADAIPTDNNKFTFDITPVNEAQPVAHLEVANGETKTTDELELGTYIVSEVSRLTIDGYTFDRVDIPNSTVTIDENTNGETIAVTATNHYHKTEGKISVTKQFSGIPDGAIPADAEYEFTITPEGESTPAATLTVKKGETQTAEHLPMGTYVITETTKAAIEDYEYVKVEYSATKVTLTSDGQEITVTATNYYTHETGDLEISKTVISNHNPDKNKDFSFTVTLSDKTINGTYGAMTFTNGVATFTLKDGDSLKATGLPTKITYTVTEADADGFATTYTGETGTITKNTTAKAEFTNTKLNGSLIVKKTVTSDLASDKTKKYHFTLKLTTKQGNLFTDPPFNREGVAEFDLADDEIKEFGALPKDATYEVTETTYDGFTTTYSGKVGKILHKQTAFAELTNTRDTGNLKLSKKLVSDRAADADQEFTFTITLSDTSINKTYSGVVFTNGVGTVTLKGGASKLIEGLPVTVGYTVTEAAATGFSVTKTGDTGVISTTESEVEFTNTRETGSLELSKVLVSDAAADASKEFEFTIQLSDTKINKTYSGVQFTDGKATVKLIGGASKLIEGLPTDVGYTVTEATATGFSVTKTGDTGTISTTKSEVKFTNTRETGDLELSKVLVSDAAADAEAEFNFTITLGDDTISKAYSGVQFTKGVATVTLKGGESKLIEGLPTGVTYTITEETSDLYTTGSTGSSGTISTTKSTAEFTNTRKTGNLELSKILVSDAAADKNVEFTFTVTLRDTSINKTYSGVTFTNGVATVNLKGSQNILIKGLPVGIGYTVTEETATGFSQTGTVGVEGTISTTKSSAAITNKRDTGNLKLSKVLVSDAAADKEVSFEFTITLSDKSITKAYSGVQFTEGVATVTLKGGESKLIEGLPTDIGYTVTEANAPGFQVTKDGDTGTITTTLSTATFTNTRDTGDLEVTKSVTSTTASDKTKDFNFTVTLSDTSIGGTEGKAYGDMTFTNGVATFTLKHGETKKGTGLPTGITYTVEEETATGFITTSSEVTGQITTTEKTASFTNTKEEGDLIVSKTVSSIIGSDKTIEFSFTVTLDDDTVNGTYGEMTFTNGVATFTLKSGESKTATGLAKGLGYTVTETDNDLFTATWNSQTGTIGDTPSAAACTNTRKTGDLKLSKELVSDRAADANQVFTFTVTLDDDTISGTFGGMTFDAGEATVTLKGGENATATGLPAGIGYTITEASATGFSQTGKTGDSGIISTTLSEATFTNTRETGDLELSKTLISDRAADADVKFTFTVTLGDTTIGGTAGKTYGDMTFINGVATVELKGGESATATGLPTDITYTITEASATGFEQTGATGDTGTISTTKSSANFTNTRKTGDLELSKILVSDRAADANQEFEFTVTLGDTTIGGTEGKVYGGMTFISGVATVKLKGGESAKAEGLPTDVTYTITEKDAEGFTTGKTGESGTISTTKSEAVFTNTRNVGDLELSKVLVSDRAADADKSFEFIVTLGDTTISGTYGNMTFVAGVAKVELKGGEKATATGLPTDITYTITEKDVTGFELTSKTGDEGTISTTKSEAVFTNTRNTGDLELSKKLVSDRAADADVKFEFTVTLGDTTISGTYGDMTFAAGVATVKLNGGESAKAEGLPTDVTYTITEKDAEGFTTGKTGESGTISTTKSEAVFTNTREKGDLELSKTLISDRAADADQVFTFTVTLSDTTIGGTYGDMTFAAGVATVELKGGEKATATGLPTEITYTIIEADATGFELTGKTGDTGTISTTKSEAVFTNTRKTGDLELSKVLVSDRAADADQVFTFTVTLDDDTINGTYGDMSFENGVATVTLKGGKKATATGLPTDITYEITEKDATGFTTGKTGDTGSISTTLSSAVFTNTRNTGDLELSKVLVSDRTADASKEFEFTIVLTDTTITKAYSGVQFTDGKATVILKGGESKLIEGLPTDIGYTITEKEAAGFTKSKDSESGTITTTPSTVTFTNTRETGDLEVTKTVYSSTASDKQKGFSFTVTLSDNGINGTYGGMAFTDGVATFTLKDGETKLATGLPTEITYTVEEEADGKFITTKTGETGGISLTKAVAAFTNSKDEGGLQVSKTVKSILEADKNIAFHFTVELDDETVNGAYGDMTFENGVAEFDLKSGETKSATGLAKGIGYTVTETDNELFTTTYNGNTGKIGAETSTAAFTNTRKTGDLELSKVLVSDAAADAEQEFEFTVTLGNDTINGTFGGMTFENGAAKVTLKGGESATASGLPIGITYTITEKAADGFTTGATGDTSTISTTKSSAKFTNTRKTGNLELSKKVVSDAAADANVEFTFTVTLSDKKIGGTAGKTYGDMTFKNGVATVTLKGGESAKAEGLPTGITYTITEATADGFTTGSTGDTGTISTTLSSAVFTNTRETGDLELSKKVVSDAAADVGQEFEFTVTLSDTTIGGTEGKAYGDMTFTKGVATVTLKGGESAKAEGLPTGITYTITEATADGFTTGSTGDTGTISTTLSNAVFTNTRETGDLELSKKVVSDAAADAGQEFKFTVTLSDTTIGGDEGKTYGDMTFKNGVATVTLKGGESAKAEGLPTGITYTITEATADGFTTGSTGDTGTISTTLSSAVFTNTRKTGDLELSKKVVSDAAADAGQEFKFTVTLSDTTIGGAEGKAYGGMTFKKGVATVTLKGGESAKAEGLPTGITYIITEADADGFTTGSTGEEGTISTTLSSAVFTNTREKGDLELSKILISERAADADVEFTFTVELSDTTIGGDEGKAYGGMTFKKGVATVKLKGGASAKATGLPTGITYTITEADATGFTLTSKTGDAGTISTTTSEAVFTNTRKTGNLELSKKLVSDRAADANQEFEFTVTLGDDTINGTYGDMSFEDGVATVKLKGGEKATAKDLPTDITYIITEKAADGFTTGKTGEEGTISTTKSSAVFTNTRDVGDLELSKVLVSDRAADADQVFVFTVKLGDTTISGTYGDMTFDKGVATVKLKGGESSTAEDLPTDITYTITEAAANGFKLTGKTGDTGTISTTTSEAEFTNTREVGDLEVKKTVTSSTASDLSKEFSFKVELSDKSISGTYGAMSFTNGVATFTLKHGETKTAKGLPTDITYKVTETKPDGWIVTESDAEGTITTTAAVASFNNKKDEGGLTVSKTVSSDIRSDKNKAFHFTVTLDDTTVNGKYGDMTFENGVATFDLKDNESKSAVGLAKGIGYTVTEETDDLFETTWTGETGTIIDNTPVAAFTNTRKTGDLELSKVLVSDRAADANQEFEFTVTLGDTTLNKTYGDMAFENGVAKVTLKGGASATATGLPVDITYKITEKDATGFELTGKTGDEGTISTTKSEAKFTNTRETGDLELSKTLVSERAADANAEFTFTVKLSDETIGGDAGKAYGDMTFTNGVATVKLKGGASATATGLPTEIDYTITEAAATGFKLTGKTGDTGTISTEKSEAEFTNTRETGDLELSKVLVSERAADADAEFTFTVRLSDTTIGGAEGKAYGGMTFTNGVATVTLKGGEKATATGLPTEIDYTITEAAATGFSLTGKTGDTGTISTTKSEAVFTNTRETGDLELSKALVSERAADANVEFTFTVQLSDTTIGGAEGKAYGGMTFKNGVATVKLKGGASAKATGLPTEIDYTITEAAATGFTLSGKTGDEGTISTEKSEAEFTNTRETGDLELSKVLVSDAAGDANIEFKFTVQLSDTTIGGAEGKAYGDMTFKNGVAEVKLKGGASAKATGLPTEIDYTITEAAATGFTLSGKTGNTGTISTTKSEAVFTNTRDVGGLELSKAVVSDAAADHTKKFTFTVKLSDTKINKTYDDMTFVNGVATVELADKEIAKATGLPTDLTYEITEASATGFTLTGKTGDTGTITTTKSEAVFTNTRETGDLELSKAVVSDAAADHTTKFTFTVKLSDTKISKTYGDMTFLNGVATVELADKEKATATGLPTDLTYEITEASATGFVQTGKTGDTGTISTTKSEAVFTNTRETGDLELSKAVVSDAAKDANVEFTFTVKLSDNTIGGAEGKAYGDMTFKNGVATVKLKKNQKAKVTGLPTDLTYEITEAAADGFKITGQTNDKGIISTTPSEVTFTNTRDVGGLEVKKTVTSSTAADLQKDFNFTVTLSDTTISGTYGGMTFTNGVATFTLKHGESKKATDLPTGITYKAVETKPDGYVLIESNTEGEITTTLATASFNNSKEEGHLQVSKTVVSDVNSDKQKLFHFTVTLDDKTVNGKYGGMTFMDGIATFDLKDGEVAKATGLARKIKYSVTEEDDDLFETTWTGETGTIGETMAVAACTNTRKTGDLELSKKLVSDRAKDADQIFTFTVKLGEAISGTYGDMVFDRGTATVTLKDGESAAATGLPVAVSYKITEKDIDGFELTGVTGKAEDEITEAGAKVEFENTRETGDLKLSKVLVSDRAKDADQIFEFTVTLDDNTISGTYGDMTFAAGVAKVELKGGENAEATGLPTDVTYKITEKNATGFECTGKTGDTGTISTTKSEATFTNTRETGDLKLSKVLVSKRAADANQLFEFTVTLDDNTISGTYGDMTFAAGVAKVELKGGENATATGLPTDVTYKITEKDTTGFELTGTTGDTGTISTTQSEAVFTNTRETGDLELSKVLVSDRAADADKVFEFTVTLDDTTINGTYGDMVFATGVAKVALKGGESAEATGLPTDVTYTIAEASAIGFERTGKTGDTGTISTTKSEAVFTNTRETGKLELSKKLISDRAEDADYVFTFTITLGDTSISKTYSDVAFTNGVATVTLKGGQSKLIEGLPTDITYKITEANAPGFELTDKTGNNGEISLTPSEAVFTNTRDTGDLTVKKTVPVGSPADPDKAFEFTVTLSETTINKKFGDMTFVNGVATFSLKANETCTATGLPTEIDYTVTEEQYAGYSTEAPANATGSIVVEPTEVEFINTYDAKGSIPVHGVKKIENRWFVDSQDSLIVTLNGSGGTLPEKNAINVLLTNEAQSAGFTFDDICYELADLDGKSSKTFSYTVTEIPDMPGTKSESLTSEFTVTVTDTGLGYLDVKPSYGEQGVVFTNTYNAEGEVLLGGTKTLKGRYFSILDTLTVTAYEGNTVKAKVTDIPLGRTTNTAEYELPAIFYSLDEIGAGKSKDFTYTVVETASMDGADETVGIHKVVVWVRDNYSGKLIIDRVTVDGVPVGKNNDTEVFGGIDFLNTYRVRKEAPVAAKKELKGKTLEDGEFTFTLKGNDEIIQMIGDRANQSKTNKVDGTVIFDELLFAVNATDEQLAQGYVDIANLPMVQTNTKYHYDFELTLAEADPSSSNKDIRIEGTDHYNITVNVDYEMSTGELTISIEPEDTEFKFTNLKNSKDEVDIGALKVMKGRELVDNEFTFTLKNRDALASATPVNGDAATVTTDDSAALIPAKFKVDQAKTNMGKTEDGQGIVTFDTLKFAVYPTDEQIEQGYIDVTNEVTGANNEYSFVLRLDEDLTKLKPEVIPVSPMREDGTMGYDVTITLKYDPEQGELKATAEPESAKMTFINGIVKVQKVDVTDQHELEGAVIEIYEKDETQPDGRGELVTTFISGKTPTEVEKLKVGVEYIMHEEVAPLGYTLTSDTTFHIDENGDVFTSGNSTTDDKGYKVLLIEDSLEEKPTFEKKIQDTNDTDGKTSDWQDSADYDIGDEVPYRLKAKLANNVTDYKNYYITFHDTMEKGLTFNNVSKVTVNGTEVAAEDYKLITDEEKHSFDLTLTWDNGDQRITDTSLNSAKVEVYFTAILNDDAVLGAEGNVNTAKLEYRCHALDTQSGKIVEDHEETKEDSVIAFTYQAVINKVTDKGEALKGAEFKLEKKLADGTMKPIAQLETEPGTTFTFKGLDDGDYLLTETKVPVGYYGIDPIGFTVTAEHNIVWEDGARTDVLTRLTGDVVTGTLTFGVDKIPETPPVDIVNKVKVITETGIKVWDDDNNRDALRPKSIEVELWRKTKDAAELVKKVKLSEEKHWIETVEDLPIADNEGHLYEYTWIESVDVVGYTKSGSNTTGTLTTLINTHEVEKVPVSVKKVWVDDDNKNGKRPASIEVQLYADGLAVGTPVTLDASNDWTYDWGELPKNVNENNSTCREIRYSVAETKIPDGYICKVTGGTTTGFVITNTYENGKLIIEKEFDIKPWEPNGPNDEPIDIPVIKTWDDNGNKDGNRPESVTVRLLANGAEVANAQLTKDNGWRYTFTGMPRLDENKEEIKYTISEDPVTWYSAEINGFNIRNIYEPELINVWVHKEWEDNFNATSQRPESIVMTLNNGMRVVLSPENNWTAGIYNLPTRVNGHPFEYKWTEQRVLGYDKISEDVNGFTTTITNRVWHRNTAAPTGGKAPKTAGEAVYVFDDYETPLGVEIVINHVGDCFD